MIIKLPDGRSLQARGGRPLKELLAELEPRAKSIIIGAKLDGELIDLHRAVPDGARVELIPIDSPEAREIYRHSLSHILAQAVKRLIPEAKLAIGPAIEDGFYYDFDLPASLSHEDLEKISKEMERIIRENHPFERLEVSKEEARRIFAERGEAYKLELLEGIPDEEVSLYKDGEFLDLCRGPHMLSTGQVKHFKLLEVAGAYWRGDERNKMLQRVYGTAFYKREELESYLKQLEEAAKRDHRRLGRELDLFNTYDEGGTGLIYWHPKGARVRLIIEDFWRAEHLKNGYELIYTPHIGRARLWEKSGHLDFYRENMYAPIDIEGQEYYLKPMNCPFHILIYKSQPRSYRDLPLRWAELGTVYRYERSGVLHGLLRVRGFTQDDAHIFCRPDQVEDEILKVLDFSLYMLEAFGFKEYELILSVRDPATPEKYAGSEESWELAEGALARALERRGFPYTRMEGEAVFYGPKIDIKVKDAIGRSWQLSTIQFDFNLPERFDLTFMGEDSREHRPYMIHRALLGSLERFLGILIEHYAGAFPVWLAPVQAAVLPVIEKNSAYAERVVARLREAGLRAELHGGGKTLSYRIRQAQLQKVPYMLVVGDREEAEGQVAPRLRTGEDLGKKPLEEFISFVRERVASRAEI
ncbi:MAG: threonine--tRNA ligase [Candidatus Acetothermia bacterium]|jgi:threonyl-tRNA synthetase|nr:threonine--tRNA ligase [Candidatus Acetothermia bacterium]MDH7505581.1 threonine--tRNA ligase [Candidatus Acetothermia bacterium]